MPEYGEIRVDYITYTTGTSPNEGQGTVTVSGLINNPTFSGNVIVGNDLTVSGDLNADNITISTGIFASGLESTPSITFIDDLDTGIYSPAANKLAISTNGTGRLFVDASGKIGVGIASPGRALDIVGSSIARPIANTTNATDWFSVGGITANSDPRVALGIFVEDSINNKYALTLATQTNFSAGITEKMRITSGGNVGIGTTSPQNELSVVGTANATTGFTVGNEDGNTSGGIFNAGSTSNSINIVADPNNAGANSRIAFFVDSTTTEAARIDSSGRLLVGTSSARNTIDVSTSNTTPSLQLEGTNSSTAHAVLTRAAANQFGAYFSLAKTRGATIGGSDPVVSNDSLGRLRWLGDDGTDFEIAAQIEAFVDGTPGTNDMPGRLVFSTTADGASNPTERMRITNGGVFNFNTGGASINVGSGTTDGLTIYSTSNPSAGVIQTSTNDGPAMYLRRRTGDGQIINFRRDTTSVGNISVTTTNTSYNTSSDYRLKENVVPMTGAADRVKALKPSRFNFIAEPDIIVDGFLAHEAQTVVPEAVTGTHNEVDDDGNAVMQAIDQSKLVPLLTGALQEALAKIEALEQRLADAGL